MDAVEYFEAKAKMTDNCEIECNQCPLWWVNNARDCPCRVFETMYPKEAISIVEKWQKENMFRVPKDTPIDAKVLCADFKYSERAEWVPRHFAGFKGEIMTAWLDGYTSHTTTERVPWTYMKLVD